MLRSAYDRGYVGARRWRAANPFTRATFRYILSQDSDEAVKVEVLDATGEVVWQTDGPKDAGYHEVTWGAARGGRGFGGFRRGGGRGGQRAGQFAVRISRGSSSTTQPFTVHDRTGGSNVLGQNPGEELVEEEEEGGEARSGY